MNECKYSLNIGIFDCHSVMTYCIINYYMPPNLSAFCAVMHYTMCQGQTFVYICNRYIWMKRQWQNKSLNWIHYGCSDVYSERVWQVCIMSELTMSWILVNVVVITDKHLPEADLVLKNHFNKLNMCQHIGYGVVVRTNF